MRTQRRGIRLRAHRDGGRADTTGRFRCRLVCLILTAAALCGNRTQAQPGSCQVTWLDSVELSFDTIPSTSPHLVLSGDTVQAIWFGDATLTGPDPHDGIQYVRSFDGGSSFSQQRRLVPFDSCLGSPGLLAGTSPWLYIAYLAPMDTSPYYGLAVLRSSDNGDTWSPPRSLIPGVTPRIITAEDSTVCIEYLDPFQHTTGIIRTTNNGSAWIVTSSRTPMFNDFKLRNGTLHAVSSELDFLHEEVAYYSSANGGATWIGPTYVSPEDAIPSLQPALAVDDRGTLSIVWNDTGSVVYRRSNGINEDGDVIWEPQQVLSEGRGAIFADVAAEGPFVSVAWDTEIGQRHGIRLRQSNSEGLSYCPTDTPAASVDAVEPAIEVSGDQLLLVWSEVSGTNSEILSRRGILHEDLVPKTFVLQQNYPNPFNGSTVIKYDLPYVELVNLSIYNILGQRVLTLVDGIQDAAHYEVRVDASRLPSGVYFYRLRTWHFVETRKMVVVR